MIEVLSSEFKSRLFGVLARQSFQIFDHLSRHLRLAMDLSQAADRPCRGSRWAQRPG